MKQVTFFVPSKNLRGAQVTGLQMRIHDLSFNNKVSVRLNQHDWVPLNNTTVIVKGLGQYYGGIGGPVATLDVVLPLKSEAVFAGANTLTFRFSGTDGVSTGFRVLSFNFVKEDGEAVLPPSTFRAENPATWKPPLNNRADIAAGQQLWRNGRLVDSSLPGAQPILARCGDCHAQDGRDLKYFNFSNASIIARSRYHQLTEKQGMQIASYIRSLKTPNPGRPWNPPFQPGPGMDSKPVSEWAAGAGLDWVLAHDTDTLPYIFPNGISEDAISPRDSLNAREIPISFQLPDWNHWLPRVHPKDAWGSAFVSTGALRMYNGEGTGLPTWNLRARLAADPTYANRPDGYLRDARAWNNVVWGTVLNPGRILSSPRVNAERRYDVRLWQMVKTWELHQEFALEERGQAVFGAYGEPRMWLATNVWQTSPFLLGIWTGTLGVSPQETSGGIGNRSTSLAYLNNAWLYQTLIFTNGNKSNVSDWSWEYLLGFTLEGGFLGELTPARALLIYAKAIQSTLGPDDPTETHRQWRPFQISPTVLFETHTDLWHDMDAKTYSILAQAMLDAWIEKNSAYTQAQYLVGPYYDPTYIAPTVVIGGSLAYTTYHNIQYYKALGLNTNRAVDWAKTMWKAAPEAWDALRP